MTPPLCWPRATPSPSGWPTSWAPPRWPSRPSPAASTATPWRRPPRWRWPPSATRPRGSRECASSCGAPTSFGPGRGLRRVSYLRGRSRDTDRCRWVPVARGVDDLRSKLVSASMRPRPWAAGARSERATGHVLEALEPAGFAVVQLDDHLVVGPTGVWLVGSRDFPYPLSVGHRGGLWTGWHPVSEVLEEAQRSATAVAAVLHTPVEPVVA